MSLLMPTSATGVPCASRTILRRSLNHRYSPLLTFQRYSTGSSSSSPAATRRCCSSETCRSSGWTRSAASSAEIPAISSAVNPVSATWASFMKVYRPVFRSSMLMPSLEWASTVCRSCSLSRSARSAWMRSVTSMAMPPT